MHTVGFCLIKDIDGFDEEELMKAAQTFHSFPIDVKMAMALKHFAPANQNIYHGYFPFIQGDPSHKEIYDMARPFEDITTWEKGGCPLYEPTPWTLGQENAWILETF